MAEKTGISWADHTFNPWLGCSPVSPACHNCYAEALVVNRLGVGWGPHALRRRTAASTWQQVRRWNRRAERAGTRARVFCASLADVFDNKVPPEWREDLWELIRQTPQLDWLLLTKRPSLITPMLPPSWGKGWANVWLGTTVENQEEAERRIPHLLAAPAVLHFLSCEPLLGPLNLTSMPDTRGFVRDVLRGERYNPAFREKQLKHDRELARIGWVIAGGETGNGARPSRPEWVWSLRDQCAATATPFHFKQWGDWHADAWAYTSIEGENPAPSMRIGKRKSGRLVEGVEHLAVPHG